ncbi:MAG TPA: glycosyltransferase family 4 protein [Smithella sp.]|nr:glycosyltransferase family 4 protein [Smithella sp.]
MKLIIISPFAPYPPNSGGRIRQWELIKYLGERHDLTLAFFINRGEEKILEGAFEKVCSEVHMITHAGDTTDRVPPSLPWPMRAYAVEPMKNLMTRLAARGCDVLITEFIYMAQHRHLFAAPAVLHEHNIESSIFRQYAEMPEADQAEIFGIRKDATFWKATWMMMRRYENEIWPQFDLRITVSHLDKQEMDSRCPDGKSMVAENGVNTKTMRPLDVSRSKNLLYVGTMNYFPNEDGALFMADTIMPHVWSLDPDIRLYIVGNNMPRKIKALGDDPRIQIFPDVPDIRAVAARCCLSVVPLRFGGGTRIKILESFALGLPVVSTSKGCEGLAVEDGKHLLIRDNPEDFAAAVVTAVNNHELSDTLRQNGRMLAEQRYDWRKIFEVVEETITGLVAR